MSDSATASLFKRWAWGSRWRWELALAGTVALSIAVLAMSENGHSRLASSYDNAMESMWASERLDHLLRNMTEAESAERGFRLSGNPADLMAYENALPRIAEIAAEIRQYFARHGDLVGSQRFEQINFGIGRELGRMKSEINRAHGLRASPAGGGADADAVLASVDETRDAIGGLQLRERERTQTFVADWSGSLYVARIGITAMTALDIILLVLMMRYMKDDWLRSVEREKHLDRLVEERTDQLVTLASHLQQVSETEKTRLGRELHDELGAILTAAKMDVSWVRGKLGAEQATLTQKLERAMRNLDQGIQVKRRIIEDLRPTTLASFGLTTAARELAEQCAERAGWALRLDLPEDDPDLPEEVEIALFRILQEALNNASKYAQAKHVNVRLTCAAGQCALEIKDDGVGFRLGEGRHKAHGLLGMRQRLESQGGRFRLDAEPGKGTLIEASLPCASLAKVVDPVSRSQPVMDSA